MTSRRVQKAAQAVREVVSMAILTDMNDPRVQDVTVTRVEVMPDMRKARVHVSVMGNDTKQRLCLQGLKSAAGYLQSKVASQIDTRYTPRLEFVLDMGVKKSIEMAEILARVLPDTHGAAANAGETNAGETNAGETNAGETNAGETNAGDADAGETNAGDADADAGPDRTDPPSRDVPITEPEI